MNKIEIERVFLIKKLPHDISKYKPVAMDTGDFYDFNKESEVRIDHLTVRRKDNSYEIRKKEGNSEYKKIEHTIYITKEELDLLMSVAPQRHQKNMYLYPFGDGRICEIDIYLGKLKGYARVEVEFESEEEMRNFVPPQWFSSEITDLNHIIHKNLGSITFNDLKQRYSERGIEISPILIN
jgi:CYTH domain-containing protein